MRISVLTCVTGEPESLERTRESLRPFLNPAFKWIIKFSGASSPDFIRRFESAHTEITQREDKSLYEAMNQGLELLRTELYFVIGAGDRILPEGGKALSRLQGGNGLSQTANFAPAFLEASKQVFAARPGEISRRMSCPHPGAILNVANSRDIGGFDTSYRIASDYDHLSRYLLRFPRHEVLDVPPIVSCSAGGISEIRALEGYLEEELIRKRVWKATDLATYGRILERSAGFIGRTIRRQHH
jgi:glycosyltransferase